MRHCPAVFCRAVLTGATVCAIGAAAAPKSSAATPTMAGASEIPSAGQRTTVPKRIAEGVCGPIGAGQAVLARLGSEISAGTWQEANKTALALVNGCVFTSIKDQTLRYKVNATRNYYGLVFIAANDAGRPTLFRLFVRPGLTADEPLAGLAGSPAPTRSQPFTMSSWLRALP